MYLSPNGCGHHTMQDEVDVAVPHGKPRVYHGVVHSHDSIQNSVCIKNHRDNGS